MGKNTTTSTSLFITSQKLQERRAALGKMTFENEKHRAIWQDVLKLELISSEESGYDDGDEVIYVKPLPWRSKQFSEFVAHLDIQAGVGEPSARVCPTTDVPDWVFADK